MLAAADLLLRLRLSGYLTSCCSGVALPLWPVWVCPSRWVVHLGAGFCPLLIFFSQPALHPGTGWRYGFYVYPSPTPAYLVVGWVPFPDFGKAARSCVSCISCYPVFLCLLSSLFSCVPVLYLSSSVFPAALLRSPVVRGGGGPAVLTLSPGLL